MSDLTKQITRDEVYLATISGDYSGELPAPMTRVQEYLEKIARNGVGSGGETVDLSEYAKRKSLSVRKPLKVAKFLMIMGIIQLVYMHMQKAIIL